MNVNILKMDKICIRRIIRRAIPVVLIVCLLTAIPVVYFRSFSLAPTSFGETLASAPVVVFPSAGGNVTDKEAPEGMEFIAAKGQLVLYADLETGMILLRDLRSGEDWKSMPEGAEEDPVAKGAQRFEMMSLITVTDIVAETNVVRKRNSYTGSFQKKGIDLKKISDGFEGTFAFPDQGYSIPVKVYLTEDSLITEIDTAGIEETGESRIYQIGIMPFFGSQGSETEGCFILPDGSGSLMYFNNGKGRMNYRVPVYGEDLMVPKEYQLTSMQRAAVPYFAISQPDGAMLAVIEEGAASGTVFASSAGGQTAQNQASCEFSVRSYHNVTLGIGWNARDVAMYEEGPIHTGVLRMRYFPASEEQEGIAGLAGMLGEYLESTQGIRKSSITGAPVFITTPAAIRTTRSILGIPTAISKPLMTYHKIGEMVKDLNESGVSELIIKLEGWSGNALKGGISSGFDPVSGLGSRRELNDLLEVLTQTGGKMYLLPQITRFSKGLGGVSFIFDHSKDLSLSPVELRTFKKNTYFEDPRSTRMRLLKSQLSVSAFVKLISDIPEHPSLSVSTGEFGSAVYNEGSGSSPNRNIMEDMVRNTDLSGTLGDVPNMYALHSAEAVIGLADSGSGFDVCDASVPFLPIALRGLIPYSFTPINDSGSWNDAFLRSVSAGAMMHYRVLADPPADMKDSGITDYYAADYEEIKPFITEQQGRIRAFYEATSGLGITRYEILENGLVLTEYENGGFTLVNMTEKTLTREGQDVPAKDFVTGGIAE